MTSSPAHHSIRPFDYSAVEALYQLYRQRQYAISAHLARLRSLAADCTTIVEFGVKQGASSTALLLGVREQVISYDVIETVAARQLQQAAGDRWDYRIESSLTAPVTPCDLLFIDSRHTYDQVHAELTRHADAVQRYLVFHDTLTFGSVGADGESGAHSWQYTPGVSVPRDHLGIRPAIDQLMIRDASWRIMVHYLDSHGLLVLARR